MSAEKATETTPNINVVAETEKAINKVSNMDFNTMLNEWIIPYGTKFCLRLRFL
ncbi:small-conductance mechanosensitive channel [Actinobacillus pleuropneumoniae]|nr:small-conductance mechanosensitive channel [Actinobacillus pleuropneumoniae]